MTITSHQARTVNLPFGPLAAGMRVGGDISAGCERADKQDIDDALHTAHDSFLPVGAHAAFKG